MNKPSQATRVLAFSVVVALAIHVTLALTSLVFPQASRFSKLFTVYKRYVLLGPYFTNKTVRSSNHLYVSYKSKGQWIEERDYAQEDFDAYCSSPWRYDKLHVRQYPLCLARQLARKHHDHEALCASKNCIALLRFCEEQWIDEPVDSISFSFRSRTYLSQSDTYLIDTLFSVKCKVK